MLQKGMKKLQKARQTVKKVEKSEKIQKTTKNLRCARPRRSRTLLRAPLALRGPPPGAAAGASWAADPSRSCSSFGLAAAHRGKPQRLGALTRAESSRSRLKKLKKLQ